MDVEIQEATPVPVGPWVKGLVVDTSGRPVAGARISVMRSDRPRSAESKPDGTFVIAMDESNLQYTSLLAEADGGARHGIFRFDDQRAGTKDARTLARIVLKPNRKVRVSVVDGRGSAVEGAKVKVLDVAFPVAEGRTDVRGVVELSAPADVMTQWIFGLKPGLGFDYFENYLTVPSDWSPLPRQVSLVLNGARTVRVRAVDSANRPVAGVEIAPVSVYKKGKLGVVNLHASVKASTDPQGLATLDWLPIDALSQTRVWFAAHNYTGTSWAQLKPGALSDELTLRVLRPTAISGKVTRPDGVGAAGILVIAEELNPYTQHGPQQSRTSDDGSYSIDVIPDQGYMIHIRDEDWAARARTVAEVREGVARTGIDFRLERGGVIRGRVTGSKPSQPAPGLLVTLIDENMVAAQGLTEGFARTALTDRAGRYAFRVPTGNYFLRAPYEFGVTPDVEQLKIEAGQEIQKDLTVTRLALRRRRLRGVVRSNKPDGLPIARAIVVSAPIRFNDQLSQTFTDDDGTFEISLPIGRALVYARDPAGSLAGFAIMNEDADTHVTVVARPAAIARGRVVDRSGVPFSDTRVAYSISDGPENAITKPFAGFPLVTDLEGRFTVPGLFIGARCVVYAIHPAGGGLSSTKEFKVKDARQIEVGDVVLHPR